MARKQDEMSLDDELTAAFLEGDNSELVAEEEPVETPDNTQAAEETEEYVEDNGDGWDDDADNLPGQVAVDVYELPYGIDLNVPYSAAVDVCQFASVSLEIRHNLVAHLFLCRAVWRNLRIHNED